MNKHTDRQLYMCTHTHTHDLLYYVVKFSDRFNVIYYFVFGVSWRYTIITCCAAEGVSL